MADIARVPHRNAGNARQVLDAATGSVRSARAGVLALVLETEGSTYADAGAMALFDGATTQVGWLSGGCLEPEIARHAAHAVGTGELAWIELDTREDEDLFSGSALGCRGRLRMVLVPLRALDGVADVFDAWRAGGVELRREVHRDGTVSFAAVGLQVMQRLPGVRPQWAGSASAWSLPLPPPPEALVLGAGPETPVLLRLLRDLGWRCSVAERRQRWRDAISPVDALLEQAPAEAACSGVFDAALVMHHNFELDREALEAVAHTDIAFIGLLGPQRRREDLFKLLAERDREALRSRLRSPVGLDLGGQGPEAIALSIAAQLQAWWHGAHVG